MFIGPGVAQAYPRAQNSPDYAKQARLSPPRFTSVWSVARLSVLYLN